MNGYAAVGQAWDVAGFRRYLAAVDLSWADGVCVHHTAYPDLKMRPEGFRIAHMRNLESFYRGKGWSAGPHLFVDDDQAFGLCPLGRRGVHAVSFNAHYVGLEVLGNYDEDHDDPHSGRGWSCWRTAAEITAALMDHAGWEAEAIKFHRDDPRTSKSCPGSAIVKPWFVRMVAERREARGEEDAAVMQPSAASDHEEIPVELEKVAIRDHAQAIINLVDSD